ncbi:TetR/AcrR family transcriptional regulator [Rhodococcoides fascians]|jgi:AcrR family transcriptional regulator|uniref:TetR/AcrR family transcriptional regulator n=1 Tax=Rhodococcoides fascians TaxID=1828 RepID=UPI001E358518|nr:TetR/AcrR family transcriptional regulator [Rhodococcus fascians]
MATSGRPRQFDEAHVLEAAMLLFWQRGYESTSLAQLRDATGLSSASIYNAFGSKEGLFERTIQHYVSRPGSVQNLTADKSVAPRDALTQLLHASVDAQLDPSHPGGCLIALAATVVPSEVGSKPAEIVAAQRERDRTAIKGCVDRAAREGVFGSSPVSTEAIAVTVHTFILGLSIQVRDGVSSSVLHAGAGALLALWAPRATTSA